MKHGRIADFFFVGLGILPIALTLGGLPDLMIVLFVPLMLVACLFGMAEQIEEKQPREENTPGAGGGASPREAPGLTFRKSEGKERLPGKEP